MNKNAEAFVLSACMDSELAVTKTIENLIESDFTELSHRNLFTAIQSLFNKNSKIDMLTIMDEMNKLNLEYDVGFINEVSDLVLTDSHIDTHISIVKEHSLMLNVKRINAEIGNKIGANEPINNTIDFARESFMNIDSKDEDFIFSAE